MDIIVSLPFPVRNFMVLPASFNGGAVCLGCGTYAWDRLTPVEVTDGGEIDHVATGDCSPLCRVCSFKHSARIVASWPKLRMDELQDIWRQVRAAQALDAAKMYQQMQADLQKATALCLGEPGLTSTGLSRMGILTLPGWGKRFHGEEA